VILDKADVKQGFSEFVALKKNRLRVASSVIGIGNALLRT